MGEALEGFPFSIGNAVSNTPIAFDLDNDGDIELMALNEIGDIYAWQLKTLNSDDNLWWTQASYDFTNNLFIERALQPQQTLYSDLLPKSMTSPLTDAPSSITRVVLNPTISPSILS